MATGNFFGGQFFGGGFFGAVDGTTTTQQGGGGIPYSGHEARPRTVEDIRQARERVGIITERAQAVIQSVAARQVTSLEQDEQKHFEELARSLEIEGIQWEARYLEALAQQRELLMQQEIAALLQRKMNNEALMTLVMIAAS